MVLYRRVLLFFIWAIAFPVGCVSYGYNNFCEFNDGCVNGSLNCAGRMTFSFPIALLTITYLFVFRLILHALWKNEKRPRMSRDTLRLNSSLQSLNSSSSHLIKLLEDTNKISSSSTEIETEPEIEGQGHRDVDTDTDADTSEYTDTRIDIETDMGTAVLSHHCNSSTEDQHVVQVRDQEQEQSKNVMSSSSSLKEKEKVEQGEEEEKEEDKTDHLVWLQIIKLFKIILLFFVTSLYVIGVDIRYCYRWVNTLDYFSPDCEGGFVTMLTTNPSNWIVFAWVSGLLLVLPARQRQDDHETVRAIRTRIMENL